MLNQKEIQNILKKQGDVRGVVFQTDASYVLKKSRQGDLLKIENLLKEWGAQFQFKDIEAMSWYPVSWRTLSLLAIKDALGWDDNQIREMGKNAPNVSIIVKLFFKLFPDIKKFAQQIPNYWKKHYTVGELEVKEIKKEEQIMVIHLNNFSFHPVLCQYLEGYFEQATKLTRPEDSIVTAKEIECSFRNDTPYEAYQLSWSK